jgi:hypothetical protein
MRRCCATSRPSSAGRVGLPARFGSVRLRRLGYQLYERRLRRQLELGCPPARAEIPAG